EVIQRIGPCNAKIKVTNIEDVRISKRNFVIDRAKQLLKTMVDKVLPDSQEIADEVAQSVRVMEIMEFGRERLPAGPAIEESDEIIIVEGRADVLNLLKHGFKNSIAMNGTSVPQTIIELSRRKDAIAFVDGDRGGNLIIKDLINVGEIDFVTKAPDGKEVEELTKKEIHKALRSRITLEQAKLEMSNTDTSESIRKPLVKRPILPPRNQQRSHQRSSVQRSPPQRTLRVRIRDDEKKKFGSMLENLIGTRGAYLLDDKLNVLGKVPFSELASTLRSLNSGVYAIVFDGTADNTISDVAVKAGVKHIIAMNSRTNDQRINIMTAAAL
ncbi:toprim domain-containing protein, partial [Candidatus Woesearchaeota archaeon]|nr:toprim domain-containing protein [Candidatus Woesearchaeota archaeon]